MFTLILVLLYKWMGSPIPGKSVKLMLAIEALFWLSLSPEILAAIAYHTSR